MNNEEIKVLIFGLDEVRYALNISEVERILSYTTPTEMPNTPSFVEGIINYEESALPIIKIAEKFKITTKYDNNAKIIVIKKNKRRFGIIVNNVYEVKDINRELIEDVPSMTSNISKCYMKSLIKLDGGIIIFLDSEEVLCNDEEAMIFRG